MSESAMRVIVPILTLVAFLTILGALKAVSWALKKAQSPLLNRLTSVFLGLVLIAGCLWFWVYLLGNPIDELALIRHGVTVQGVITDVSSSYEFRLPNGRKVKGETGAISYYMSGFGVEVEYLPDDPAVSRIKGDGCSTLTEWLWLNVGLFILFFSPGVGVIFWGGRRRTGGSLAANTKSLAQ